MHLLWTNEVQEYLLIPSRGRFNLRKVSFKTRMWRLLGLEISKDTIIGLEAKWHPNYFKIHLKLFFLTFP
jgi:hypothetical protein